MLTSIPIERDIKMYLKSLSLPSQSEIICEVITCVFIFLSGTALERLAPVYGRYEEQRCRIKNPQYIL